MNYNASVTYAAQSVEEFLALIDQLQQMGVSPVVAVSAPKKDEAGPYEQQYKQVTGKRFRLSDVEGDLVSQGQTTREECARKRLEGLAPPASSDNVMDGPPLVVTEVQKDDEEEMV